MSHLNDRTLETLITGSASPADVQRIRRHVGGCRACARRLEEWRDNFTEVEQRFPELGTEAGPMATVTAEGLVLLPTHDGRRGLDLDLTTGLWIGALLMALLVGYGTFRLRATKDVVDLPPGMTLPQIARTEPESRPTAGLPTIPPATKGDSLRPKVPATRPTNPPTPPKPVAKTTDPTAPLPVSSGFKSITAAAAARRLGGPIRLIQGLQPDHIEVAPASVVPGAQSKLDVIRVVYRASEGRRILLDQQLIPADSSGFRPIEDQTLESGQTAFGTSASGVSFATWLDDDGYRLSLAMRTPLDSLKRLLPRVR